MSIKSHETSTFSTLLARTVSAQLHFLGFMAALLGTGVLLNATIQLEDTRHFWSILVFGITGIVLFGASSFYHFLSDGFLLSPRLMHNLENLDHYAIYLFIAGTYTPFLLNSVSAWWTYALLIVVWSLAIFGIAYTWLKPRLPNWARSRMVYTGIFVLMGWTILVRMGEIWENLGGAALWNLILGGLSYTIGAVVYATKRPQLFPPIFGFHELWHLFVLGGFAFHYFMILSFYI